MTQTPRATVTVLGSINMDVVLRVSGLPHAGETVTARDVAAHGGGKGANQAIAAARAGAIVTMIGRVGDDADGRFLLSHLQSNGIDCAQVDVDPVLPTGTAYVAVDDDGENQIIVAPGANIAAMDRATIHQGVLLAQLELPLQLVSEFFAKRSEPSLTILNAAPFKEGAGLVFAAADLVVINEIELAGYCNAARPSQCPNESADLAKSLLMRQQQRILVTRGKRGSVTVGENESFITEAPLATAIDSTGAGDCFCGFLAAQLSAGQELRAAISIAHRAASVAVGRPGASSSMPLISEIL
jgi:ribokinase